MAALKRSAISWTDFSSGDLNFVIGCTRVSPGCKNCYGFRWGERWGKDFSAVRIYPEKLERLRTWQPKIPFKRGSGSRPMAFVVDLGDLFHEDVSSSFILYAFKIMMQRREIDWQILTKRSGRMMDLMRYLWAGFPCDCAPTNLWLGVSVESPLYLHRINDLMDTPAAVRFVSLEPLLEGLDIQEWLPLPTEIRGNSHRKRTGHHIEYWSSTDGIAWGKCQQCGWVFSDHPNDRHLDWVIIGGESGLNRRPFKQEWAQDVLNQCRAAGVPFHGKQGSGLYPGTPLFGKGKEVREWPS